MKGVATVLHYCTNDYRFLSRSIEEAQHFSETIIIPVCDHFFNGEPENRDLLHASYEEHPDCTFVEFAFTPNRHYSPYCLHRPEDFGWTRLWNQISRYIGYLHLPESIEYTFFLDTDEIAEGRRVEEWLKTEEYRSFHALRFLSYYYALRPTLRADKLQNLVLLAHVPSLEPRFFLQIDDRHGLYQHLPEPKQKNFRPEPLPFFHHYSWVRPQTECVQKANTWGHRNELPWESEIEAAFREKKFHDLFGQPDLVFEEIPNPYFDPLSTPVRSSFPTLTSFPHVKKVTPRDIFSLELARCP